MKNTNLKTNRPLYVAVSASFICFGVGHFVDIPELLQGFLMGIGLVGCALGAYAIKHDISNIQNGKKNLLQIIFK